MSIVIDRDKCLGCEACQEICPVKAVEVIDRKAVVDFGICINCGRCIKECPFEAIALLES